MTIVGTRPEIIRLSRVIPKLDTHTKHVLVHTGQNYDPRLSDIFFEDLDLRRPDFYLDAAAATPGATIGQVLIAVDDLLSHETPDAVLILGDTNSCLAAIAAKRRKIPIFHMEAGNRCFDARVPEECNRRIVDHTADIHLPYSQIARSYLIREGIAPDQIITTGSPLREVLTFYRDRIDNAAPLSTLGLSRGQYFLVSAHREENVDEPDRLLSFVSLLNHLARNHNLPVLVTTHPRTRARLGALATEVDRRVTFAPPFSFTDYCHLQLHARAVLSDSGTITEEAALLGINALNLRDVNERPEGFEEAVVMMVGLDQERVDHALRVMTGSSKDTSPIFRLPYDYSAEHVSDKVLRIILSYTPFVRERVWHMPSLPPQHK